MCSNGNPPAAYQRNAQSCTILAFYDAVTKAINPSCLVREFTIPIRSGAAWELKEGQVCRIVATEGPQVGDINIWNLHDPRERMWAARTRQLEQAHITRGNKIWSTLPFLRPLVTITGDSLENYGQDSEGGRVHDLLGTRCDPYVNKLLTCQDFDFNCHSNLMRAILPHGLTEFDVHDVLNVFQCTGLNDQDKYYMKSCPARKGDYFEFFAEMDLLCALSTCPSGDQSLPFWGSGTTHQDLIKICRPLTVQIYAVEEAVLNTRVQLKYERYNGRHGLKFP